ncbi:MAG TPA: GlsB/YeaQ/YmgE family stress response membrane protein [Terriglobia bacterium]|nr:GlsB/YeaQ/YmgE family stress response membrane protein [Terriglobia bacterium]
MSFLWMLVVGLVVGALAKLFMPGRDPGGVIVTMLIGLAGAAVAGFLGRAVGWYAPGDAAGFIASILGAVVLLVIYRALIGRTGGDRHIDHTA